MTSLHKAQMAMACALTLLAAPAFAQDKPVGLDGEAARKELQEAWCLRVPYLCTRGNPYVISDDSNPFNRLDVQVLSWSKMRQRLAGGPDVTVIYNRGWNDAVGQVVVPARK